MCFLIRAFDSGSVGSDGRAGSRGEQKDPGVPGHDPKDALSAPHPGPLVSGAVSTSSCPPPAASFVWLTSVFFPLQSIVQHFLVLLMTSSDESLRFLSFRLDFTEHYRCALSKLNSKQLKVLSNEFNRCSSCPQPGPSIIYHDKMQPCCKCSCSHYSAWYWAIIPSCVPLWWKSWIFNTWWDFIPKCIIKTVKRVWVITTTTSLTLRAREPRLRASLGATRGRRLSNIWNHIAAAAHDTSGPQRQAVDVRALPAEVMSCLGGLNLHWCCHGHDRQVMTSQLKWLQDHKLQEVELCALGVKEIQEDLCDHMSCGRTMSVWVRCGKDGPSHTRFIHRTPDWQGTHFLDQSGCQVTVIT